MTTNNLIDILKTFPLDANVEIITGQELCNSWPIDRVGVLHGGPDGTTVVILAEDG